MAKKIPPKSGSPAWFWVLFGASFEALDPNTSKIEIVCEVAAKKIRLLEG